MDEEEEPDELHVRGLGPAGGAALAWAGARVVFDPGLRLRAPASSPAGAAAGPQVSAERPPGAIPGGAGGKPAASTARPRRVRAGEACGCGRPLVAPRRSHFRTHESMVGSVEAELRRGRHGRPRQQLMLRGRGGSAR